MGVGARGPDNPNTRKSWPNSLKKTYEGVIFLGRPRRRMKAKKKIITAILLKWFILLKIWQENLSN